jgi:hypothetical protein
MSKVDANRKAVWAKDGYIVPVFFIESENIFIPFAMKPRDRADKHIMVRLAADAVVTHRARTVVWLGEIWTSKVDLTLPSRPFRHAVDDRNRGEAISVTGISDSGEIVDLWCQFKHRDSGTEFGKLRNLGEFGKAHYNSLEPIRKAFLKLKTEIQKKD